MKQISLILVSALFLAAGCATTDPQPVVVEHKLIPVTTPVEMLTLPDPLPYLDPNKATDKELASWILLVWKRMAELEAKLISIAKFQAEQLEKLKQ